MDRPTAPRRALAETAALARIGERDPERERRSQMTPQDVSEPRAAGIGATAEAKAAERALWALGDYHRFAKQLVWGFGPELVAACGISAGQRVLDVAAGTGNTAIRAAQAGARVVASDLTPEQLVVGRREARACGVELEWVEADAEALPFGDGEFDVVTSSAGAIFAPDHQAVADELLRVCRPGGTIGLIAFTPEGLGGEFFELVGRYAPPPPPGALPPILWGSERHVRELFGDRVASLELTRKEAVERIEGGPREYVDFYKATFGPIVGLFALLAGEPERAAALDRDLLDFATRANRGEAAGPSEYAYEILVVVARRREERPPTDS
ncbi:MAG TPA: class I SAM-dependent methyltransferase [Gaiellaceae bacterium]|nr:class I SAM-dependent methyltransferase [Gaiellaceae bacterium]